MIVPPLRFHVVAKTYNRCGGHRTMSLIPGFLLTDAPEFGPAVKELTVAFHFASSGPPRPNLQELHAEFLANRLELPKIVFRRSRESIAIDIASDLIDGRRIDEPHEPSAALFGAGVAEMLEALRLLKSRLFARDDFAVDAFLDHCRMRRASLPRTNADLAALERLLNDKGAAARAAMSPWERLEIDWRDFHPDARRLLNDPFYWDPANDLSPHGNDTGFDLLVAFRRWNKRQPAGDPLAFFKDWMHKGGFSSDDAAAHVRFAADEAAIALAFAELKMRGRCSAPSVALAGKAIQRRREMILPGEGRECGQDRIAWLHQMEARLKGLAREDLS
jgi:uncharacterized protein YfeS